MNVEKNNFVSCIKKCAIGSVIGVLMLLILELVSAFLIDKEIVPVSAIKIAAFIPVFTGCFTASFIGSGKNRALITGILTGIIFFILLMALGLMFYNSRISYFYMIVSSVIVLLGSVTASVLKALIGNRL